MYTDRVAEGRLGLGAGGGDGVEQRGLGVHHAHAAPAAAAGRLDDHRVADGARDLDDLLRVLGQRAVRTRHAGHAGGLHRILGRDLVAHQADGLGRGPMKTKPRLLDALGEIGVLGQEAVAGVDGLGVGDLGGAR
jgi:hypothetical protein